MSSDIVIRVEGLGKRYTLDHAAARSGGGLRHALQETVTAPWRALRAKLRGGDSAVPSVAAHHGTTEDFWALKDVSFEVKRGEVLGIIGRNGAGKSTLLKILSRITDPTEGRIGIKGRVASLLEVGTGFHPELTGRENIYLNGAILGMSRAEVRRKFDEIVAFAEVEKFLDTPVKRYSSGMYVRLAFAVAAHLDPEILIIDEVLAVGDAQFQEKCIGRMRQVSKAGSRTVLFVSHNLSNLLSLCSRGVVLESGSLIQSAPIQAAIQTYLASRQTSEVDLSAAFVGDEFFRLDRAAMEFPGTDGSLHRGEKLLLKLDYTIEKEDPSLLIGIELLSRHGVFLAATRVTDDPTCAAGATKLGRHRAQLVVDTSILAEGSYVIRLDVGLHNQRRLREEMLQPFQVVNSAKNVAHDSVTRREIIAPNWTWKIS